MWRHSARTRQQRVRCPLPAKVHVERERSASVAAAHHDARVDGLALAGDYLERHLVAGNLCCHERQVGVEALRGDARAPVDVPRSKLAARPDDEVGDALLGLDPLVEVVVPGEHDAHVVFQEQRLQHVAQAQVGAVPIARRIQGMVEEDNLPGAARGLQLVLEPLNLLRHRVRALEREKPHVRLRAEGVVQLAVHVEQLVVALLAGVVVAERRVELHALIEQRLVRQLELLLEVLRALRTVQVVADEHDHLVLEAVVQRHHLRGQIVLGLARLYRNRRARRTSAIPPGSGAPPQFPVARQPAGHRRPPCRAPVAGTGPTTARPLPTLGIGGSIRGDHFGRASSM